MGLLCERGQSRFQGVTRISTGLHETYRLAYKLSRGFKLGFKNFLEVQEIPGGFNAISAGLFRFLRGAIEGF